MKRDLNPDDIRLWWLNTRDVEPLREDVKKPGGPKKTKAARQAAVPVLPPQDKVPPPIAPFQQKSRAMLRKQAIEAEIDLHGYSLQQAWDVLESFFARARKRGKRTVLVITGKGSLASDQTLRVQVPRWLQEEPLSQHILGYQQSLPQDGGSGAYYVYLKKMK